MKKLNRAELANRIAAHLKRFEADSKINAPRPGNGLQPYYLTNAYAGGRFVRVCYVSFQGASSLSREDAESYLAWLDAGNVGKHYDWLRAIGGQP